MIGVYFLSYRIPEIKYPKKFDLCFASHNIWHLFVNFGIILGIMGGFRCYEERY